MNTYRLKDDKELAEIYGEIWIIIEEKTDYSVENVLDVDRTGRVRIKLDQAGDSSVGHTYHLNKNTLKTTSLISGNPQDDLKIVKDYLRGLIDKSSIDRSYSVNRYPEKTVKDDRNGRKS